jgi:hypothetical protein
MSAEALQLAGCYPAPTGGALLGAFMELSKPEAAHHFCSGKELTVK